MKKNILFIVILFFCFFFTIQNVLVADASNISRLVLSANTIQLDNPLTGKAESISIPILIGKIINSVLGIVGSLALVIFIYGGFLWMLSAGKAEQIKKGQDAMLWAAIGIIVIFSAYALVHFVLTSVVGF